MVFAVSFGLLLSDYMSRQVLAATFPLLKADWGLSDAKLGALGGAVALMVGLLTLPLSLLADRIGRARSVAAMALVWSLATLACGLCASYGQLMAARLVLGAGEAAYGSVGLAVVFSVFPRALRGTITSAFMAGGVFGSFLGLSLGGAIAGHFGWRAAFFVMAALGLALTGLYLAAVAGARGRSDAGEPAEGGPPPSLGQICRALFGSAAHLLTYAASGLQLFVLGALTAWAPSYLNRRFDLAPAAAGAAAAALLLSAGVGMVACGALSDRICAGRPERLPWLAAAFALVTFCGLEAALAVPAGPLAIVCALAGLFCAGGSTGPTGAIVADATPRALHATALAVLTLANNFLGLAPGPALTGLIADRLDLKSALQIAVATAFLAAALFGLSAQFRQPKNQVRP